MDLQNFMNNYSNPNTYCRSDDVYFENSIQDLLTNDHNS